MSLTYEELREAALALPLDQRLQLADMLARSVCRTEHEWELSPHFLADLKRRSAELDDDPSAGIPWEEIRSEMEKPVPA